MKHKNTSRQYAFLMIGYEYDDIINKLRNHNRLKRNN